MKNLRLFENGKLARTDESAVGRLRVLMLSKDTSMPGGVVNFVRMLSSRLPSKYEVEFFAIGRRDSKAAVTMVTRLITSWLNFAARTFFYRPDVVHINPSFNAKSLLRDSVFLLIARLFRVRGIVVVFHGWERPLAAQIESRSVARWLVRNLLGRNSAVAVLSDSFKVSLINMGVHQRQIHVISTMFDGAALGDMSQRVCAKKISDGTILFLSRLEYEKGAGLLLEAFQIIADRFPLLKLVIAGDGPQRNTLASEISKRGLDERVALPGYVVGSDKNRLLRDAGIFVLPSLYPEGLPVAMLEAMASGCALVVTAVGGIPEIVCDRQNGIIIRPVNLTAVSLATAISALLNDEKLCREIGERNRLKAWTSFEASNVAVTVAGIYDRSWYRPL